MRFLVVFNTPYGPWSEDTRFRQCQSGLKELCALQKPADLPLFEAMLPQMLEDKAFRHLQGHANPAEATWHMLMTENPWSRKGSKGVKGRCMAFCRGARHEAKHYTARAFGYIYV